MSDINTQLVSNTIATVEKLNADSTIKGLYKQFGIQDVPIEHVAEFRRVGGVEYSAQAEIGAPGTRIIDGRVEIEDNPRLKPYWSRGRLSKPGIFEATYRTEPIAFKSLNEINALVCNATYEPGGFEDADDETVEISKRAHRAIMGMDGGFDCFLNDASTAFKNGFATFEPVWQTKEDGFKCIYAVRFREQSTVDRWLLDERQTRLVGAEFSLQADPWSQMAETRYTLPAGDTLETARLLLININATGNNFEGVAPMRVVIGLRKLKELLLQISGVSFQKYGVPIATIVRELADASAGMIPEIGSEANRAEISKMVARLQDLRAALGPVLDVPVGLKLEYQTPTNDMPDVTPVLQYIDTMIAMVFHNEGALLGNQSFGSYAMASVSDNKFMRAAPVYASRIANGLTQLLHWMIRWNHSNPESLDVLPKYTFRFAGTQDASKWTDDMVKLAASQVWTWPDEPRRMAAANMGLGVDAFDSWESMAALVPDGAASQTEGVEAPDIAQGQDIQATALNGAQVSSMVEVVQQVAGGILPREAGVRILMRAFQMSRAEANALVGEAGDGFEPAGTELPPDAGNQDESGAESEETGKKLPFDEEE